MKEYEISKNDKVLGKVSIYSDNLNKDFSSSIIETNKDMNYEKIDINKEQTYMLEYIVNDIDELFDIVSKYIYDNDKVFEEIEKIKEYNNIKTIKKDTKLNIIVPKTYLSKLNKSINNIDLNSLFMSKVHFIKNTINKNNEEIVRNFNNIINEYNNYLNSNEYEFLTDEEKKEIINKFINKINEIINYIETNTNYKYGKNYIIPILISNN